MKAMAPIYLNLEGPVTAEAAKEGEVNMIFTGVMPALPTRAIACVIFTSLRVQSQAWPEDVGGLAFNPVASAWFDSTFATSQFGWGPISYHELPGGEYYEAGDWFAPFVLGPPATFADGFKVDERPPLRRPEPGDHLDTEKLPSFVSNTYFYTPCNFFDYETERGEKKELPFAGEMPIMRFKDHLWPSTFHTPISGGTTPRCLVPKKSYPTNAELRYRSKPGGWEPFGEHTTWIVLDKRLIIIPFESEGTGGVTFAGSVNQGVVKRSVRVRV